MKLDHLKNDLKNIVIKKGAVILLLLILMGGAIYYKSSAETELTRLEREGKKVSSQYDQKKGKFEKAEKGLELFLNLNKNKLPTKDGYQYSYQRKQAIEPAINQAASKYSFKSIGKTTSEIKADKNYESQFFSSYSSFLSTQLDGPPDEVVWSFAEDLAYQIPGFLVFQEATFTRKKDINESNVVSFFNNEGATFAGAEIEFLWVTLIEKEQ